MAKRRRAQARRRDELGDLQEWQNHQYDPGYWGKLGRLGWLSGGRRSPALMLLVVLIGAVLAAPLLLWLASGSGVSGRLAPILVAALLVGGALLAANLALRARRAQPRQRHGRRRQ